jgi:ribulose bisphosphate carboxylase small subunit
MPGGVCAVLDYEVEMMAEYVSEMATRLIMPRSVVNAAFRKFVTQILTSTRLPSTTILLGMNYLAKRVNMMHLAGQNNHTEGQVWRMLTIGLLLGSKFLDDNTFQNKSWSEVSGISVHELNTLEYEWLRDSNWNLYVNLDDSKDYNAWLANWREWLETKKRVQAQAVRERTSLASPIDTEFGRPRNQLAYSTWHQQQVAEYERLSNLKRNQAAAPSNYRRDWTYNSNAWHSHASAPLTPPDSGYGTPEYGNSAASANTRYNEWFDRAIVHGTSNQRAYQRQSTFGSFHPTVHASRRHASHPSFYNYSQNIWEPPSVADCNCTDCGSGATLAKPAQYLSGHHYGQTVVG